MNFLIALTLLVTSTHLIAKEKFYPSINLLNGHIQFLDQVGSGRVEQAKYRVSKMVEIAHDQLNFDLSIHKNILSFNDVENKVTITPSFQLGFLKGANLTVEEARFDAETAQLKSSLGELLLKKERIRYKNLRGKSEFNLIKRSKNTLPIKKADLYFSRLNFKSSKIIESVMKNLKLSDSSFIGGYYSLFSGGIHLNNGRFWGSAWLDKMINIKLKFDSSITLDEDNKIAIIKVKKIKASLISIKKRVLKEIKKANLKGVKVIGNKILIDLK